MISPEMIDYQNEIQENIDIETLRKEYQDGLIIWLNGSGASPNGKAGSYRCVLDYMGHTKFVEKELLGATANQTMINGAIDAVACVNRPMRLYLISATTLGFTKGFHGKGPNVTLIQQLYKLIKDKGCQLTTIQFVNGGELIKKFVYSCRPNKLDSRMNAK